ncbi:hypothetical protein [Desulfuromonas acetoxidans]|uniref:hypothetical protein n=1 Tax=Desulfuromonas acetoxidans TaxID=891 RepID=UPI002931B66F|nr:hypothetical protein [Desulfuromonas acetoxidans]
MKLVAATLFVAGISLAGSDGPLFPWINVLGIGLIGLMTLMLRHMPLEDDR